MKTYSAKEINLMFETERQNYIAISIKTDLLKRDIDYIYQSGRINYKRSAIKKISKYLNKEPRKIRPEELIVKKKEKSKFALTDKQVELLEWAKRKKEQEKRENKIKLLKSLLVVPVTYRGFGSKGDR